MTCSTPPDSLPAVDIPTMDHLIELQSYIGTRPADVDSLLYRQPIARDLRLEPHLYNWLVLGLAPGSIPQTFPLSGGEADNSDGAQPPRN